MVRGARVPIAQEHEADDVAALKGKLSETESKLGEAERKLVETQGRLRKAESQLEMSKAIVAEAAREFKEEVRTNEEAA